MGDVVQSPVKKLFREDLDAEIVNLPGRSLEAMLGMFAHLESLALRRAKIPSLFSTGDSSKHPAVPRRQSLDEGKMERISFRELGRQVIRAAQGQVQGIELRAVEMQALVLINEWPIAEKLWAELLTDCKTPLFELNFLEELWGICPEQFEAVGGSLIRHWQQFVLLQAEVEVLLARRQSLLRLSDTLDGHLSPWLKQFSDILEKLDEKSLA
ncbi:MAG TPA: hypothetical protein VH413_10075 [Verrucomicrobiae bacterium]|jgi:hypothetical protein|nr:hypothetical protein [Verrucomicrobiae bacterium]